MSKQPIPPDIHVRTPRAPDYYTLDCLPGTEVLRKVCNIFGNVGGNMDPPVLNCDEPFERLQQSSRVKEVLRENRDHKVEYLLKDLFAFLVYYGVLIRTDCPDYLYVFDQERCHILSRRRAEELLDLRAMPTQEKRDTRLRELLHLPALTPSPAPLAEPEPGTVTPTDVRKLVVDTATASFNGMAESYPELDDVAFTLGAFAAQCAKGRVAGIEETVGNIARLVLALRDHIDREALEVIDHLTARPASEPKPRFDPRTEIRALQAARVAIDKAYQEMVRQKAAADESLEHLSIEILDHDLRQQLRFATDADRPKLEAAVARAEAKAQEIEQFIDRMLEIMAPVKQLIDQVQRRITALTVLTQPKPETSIEIPALPNQPTYDETELLDWRSLLLEVPGETGTASVDDETDDGVTADLPDLPSADATVQPSWGPDWVPGKLTEDQIAAIFVLVGRRAAASLAIALGKLGLVQTRLQQRWIFSVCSALAHEDAPRKLLRFCGSMAGLRMYKAAKDLRPTLVDELIPASLQDELKRLLVKPKPS